MVISQARMRVFGGSCIEASFPYLQSERVCGVMRAPEDQGRKPQGRLGQEGGQEGRGRRAREEERGSFGGGRARGEREGAKQRWGSREGARTSARGLYLFDGRDNKLVEEGAGGGAGLLLSAEESPDHPRLAGRAVVVALGMNKEAAVLGLCLGLDGGEALFRLHGGRGRGLLRCRFLGREGGRGGSSAFVYMITRVPLAERYRAMARPSLLVEPAGGGAGRIVRLSAPCPGERRPLPEGGCTTESNLVPKQAEEQ